MEAKKKITGYSTENFVLTPENAAKLKELIRNSDIENKTEFLEYIDKNEKHPYYTALEMGDITQKIVQSKAFKRMPGKAMAWNRNISQSDKTVERGNHVINAGELMFRYCEAMGLNADFGRAIGLAHDVGHTGFGHAGEKWYKNILQKCNLGDFAHNIQGVRVLRDIENMDLPWQLLDAVQGHNGERRMIKKDFKPGKTEENMNNDYEKSLVIPGHERTLEPATFEGLAMLFIDKISYVGQDLADGLREGVLDPRKLEPRLLRILRKFGLTTEEIQSLLHQDRDHVFEGIGKYEEKINELVRNNPTDTVLTELKHDFETLYEIDFYEGFEFSENFNKLINKTKIYFENSTDAEERAYWRQADIKLRELKSQDTTGGTLAKRIEDILLEDLIENSTEDCIAFSLKKGKAMYSLIAYTQAKVIARYSSEKNIHILEESTEKLVNTYASILLSTGFIDEMFPQYKNEPQNTNIEDGISYEPTDFGISQENIDKMEKIIGHTRKCSDRYFKDAQKTVCSAKERAVAEDLNFNHTIKEGIAKRIAVDYVSRMPDKKLVKQLRDTECLSEENYEVINKRTECEEIDERSSLYHTLVGMQKDCIENEILLGAKGMLSELNELREKVIAVANKEVTINCQDYADDIKIKMQEIKELKAQYNSKSKYEELEKIFEQMDEKFEMLDIKRENLVKQIEEHEKSIGNKEIQYQEDIIEDGMEL